MEIWQGKQFSITDPKDVSTVIYQVSKTEKEMAKNAPKLTVERLEFIEELRGENKRKTFFIDKELKVDVYKVAHHGSSYSNSKVFLDKVNPKYGIISCEKDNSCFNCSINC